MLVTIGIRTRNFESFTYGTHSPSQMQTAWTSSKFIITRPERYMHIQRYVAYLGGGFRHIIAILRILRGLKGKQLAICLVFLRNNRFQKRKENTRNTDIERRQFLPILPHMGGRKYKTRVEISSIKKK